MGRSAARLCAVFRPEEQPCPSSTTVTSSSSCSTSIGVIRELARRSPRPHVADREQPFRSLLRLLAVHEAVEEELVHPYVKRRVAGAKDAVAERRGGGARGQQDARRARRTRSDQRGLRGVVHAIPEVPCSRMRTRRRAPSSPASGRRPVRRSGRPWRPPSASRRRSPRRTRTRERVGRPRTPRRHAHGDDRSGARPAPGCDVGASRGEREPGTERRPQCSPRSRPAPTSSRSGRGTTPRAASIRRALRRVTRMPTTANSQTGYWISHATRNASGA